MGSLRQFALRRSLVAAGCAAAVFVLVAASSCWALDILIDIEVAPTVLNLQNNGQVVTVHTNLPYNQVAGASVAINELEISWWKADNRGYFVAKFDIDAVKGLPLDVGAYNTLTLTGQTTSGASFEGSADVLVIDRSSQK